MDPEEGLLVRAFVRDPRWENAPLRWFAGCVRAHQIGRRRFYTYRYIQLSLRPEFVQVSCQIQAPAATRVIESCS